MQFPEHSVSLFLCRSFDVQRWAFDVQRSVFCHLSPTIHRPVTDGVDSVKKILEGEDGEMLRSKVEKSKKRL